MDKTPEILFAYLKDILYHPSRAKLNLEELSPDYRKLGQGLQYLADWVKESNEFAQALAKGDLTQRVDFMGEFSEAFNTMTEQLAERRQALTQEK